MEKNIYLYIIIMATVTYAIRVIPLAFIRREIKNTFIRSFLYYVPYVTLAVMTFPAIIKDTQSWDCHCLAWIEPVPCGLLLLCRGFCGRAYVSALNKHDPAH